MAKKRDTTRYELYDGKKKVYIGVTDRPEQRPQEHEGEGLRFNSMRKVGPAVTRERALEWEQQAIETYRQNHRGRRPRGNKQG